MSHAYDLPEWVPTEFTPGPEPLHHGEPDPAFCRRPVGFTAHLHEPKVWEGDNA